jgi:hypothetical protein
MMESIMLLFEQLMILGKALLQESMFEFCFPEYFVSEEFLVDSFSSDQFKRFLIFS